MADQNFTKPSNNFRDLRGQRFGKLVAVSYVPSRRWECICDCGRSIIRMSSDLVRGNIKSCGCSSLEMRAATLATKPMRRNPRIRDLSGQRFGRLMVVELCETRTPKERRIQWHCICDCGNTSIVTSHNLIAGTSSSCGCYHNELLSAIATRHGHSKTGAYSSWRAAMTRCFAESHPTFKNYGARGISMDPEWRHDFNAFLRDMGPRPVGHSLERLNVNGNYEPSNCIWLPRPMQLRNRRNTIWVIHDGKTICLKELSEITGICYATLQWRHRHGIPLLKPLANR